MFSVRLGVFLEGVSGVGSFFRLNGILTNFAVFKSNELN